MKKTRILSLLLALCMVFSLFAVPVSASDSGSDVSIQSSGEDSSDKEKEKKEEEEKKKKEEEEKKKEEEEKKKKEEEEKKKEEEEKKKKEEEERKKKEEEEKKKEEEERKKKEEEEQKKAEVKSDSSGDGSKSDKSDSSGDGSKSDKSDSSGNSSKSDKSDSSGDGSKSDKSDSSGDGSGSDKSDSSGDGSGSKSDSSASSGDGSGSKSDSSDSSKGSASQSDAKSSQEDLSAQDEEEQKEEEQKEEEKKEDEQKIEEKIEEKKDENEEKKESDVGKKVHAKLVSDVSGAQTLTAADFSDYDPTDKKADGASVSFDRLITLKVTGLKADNTSEGKKNLSRIESVMTWIKKQHKKKEYKNTMFKVVIPKGTYYINGAYTSTKNRSIHLYDHTWLSMKGVTLIKSDTRNRAIIRSGTSSDSVSGYNGESNIILEGGVIDGNTRIHTKKTMHYSGVRFGHNHDILIANVHFKGNVCGHHLELCGVKDISVVGCTFSDYKNSGYTKGINRNEAIQIDVTNSATLCPTYARYDDTVSGNVVIYNSKFEDLSRGVGSHSAVFGTYYDNIVIEKNEFKDISSQAVHCENYRNCSISDNTIQNCGGGIDFNAICYAPDGNFYAPHGSLPKYESIKSYNAKTVIRGNRISVKKGSSLTNASGIYVHGGKASSERTKDVAKVYYKKAFRITGVDVEYNVISSARSAGVYLSYVGSYNVEGNQIKGIVSGSAARGMGVYLDTCSGGTIQSNHIYKTKSHGIYVTSCTGSEATPTTLYDNRVNVTQNTGCIGIYLKKSRYVDVTKNIVKARSYAVYLNGSATVTVGALNASNTLTSGAKYGVYATGKSKQGIFVQHNLITCRQEATHAASGSKINASNNAVKVKK